MDFSIDRLLRDNIRQLVPYSSARDEFDGEARIYLDANENSLGSPIDHRYHRYPDPLQHRVKEKVSRIKGIAVENIFLGNGSDECIDILFRAFCEPGRDNVIIHPPTYGMYEVSANINQVRLKKAPLLDDFQLDLVHLEHLVDAQTKIIWLCSPNNPTGNSLLRQDVEMVLNNFDGIVVIDEAYINFSRQVSFLTQLAEYPNLVVLQTLSKAWGLAGLRMGMAFASKEIIDVYNRIKPPYNISEPAQEFALQALDKVEEVNEMIRVIVRERAALGDRLRELPAVLRVYPSDANFLLVKVRDAQRTYRALLEQGIVVRDRSRVQLTEDCLRITVGTAKENEELIEAMKSLID